MDALWIILIGVLMGSLFVIWFVVRRWESRKPVEKPWQVKAAEKAENVPPGFLSAEHAAEYEKILKEKPEPPFDIPVLRDKPKDQK